MDPTTQIARAKGALSCMKKAAESGDVEASIALSKLFSGTDTGGRLLSCVDGAGRQQVNPVVALRYLVAASKQGHRESMVTVADAAAERDAANWQGPAPAKEPGLCAAHAVAWYERALAMPDGLGVLEEGQGAQEAVWAQRHEVLARLAKLLRAGGSGLRRCPSRAAGLYEQAAELAMEHGKGKLSLKYSMLADECHNELDQPQLTADEEAIEAKNRRLDKWKILQFSNHVDPQAHKHSEISMDPCSVFTASTPRTNTTTNVARICVKRMPFVTRGNRKAEPVSIEQAGPQPKDESFLSYLERHGVMRWISTAINDVCATQPFDPLETLAAMARKKASICKRHSAILYVWDSNVVCMRR